MDNTLQIFPSGVKSLDKIINGGMPKGSFVLLLEEIGSGAMYFTYTAILTLSGLMEERARGNNGTALPDKIYYISFTKPREYIYAEMLKIRLANMEDLKKHLEFIDLSEIYFSKSRVPRTWIYDESHAPGNNGGNNGDMLEAFIETLDKHSNNSLIIIDNLGDLIRSSSTSSNGWRDLITTLKSIERMSKRRNTTIYAVMVADIFDKSKQEEISECVDTVMSFKWDHNITNQPTRKMFIKKLMGSMPFVEEDQMVVFESKLSMNAGFQISSIREIIGK